MFTDGKINSEEKNNVFLSIGRLHYQKGYDVLIDIFNRFKQRNPTTNWKLYIVGDGAERQSLEIQIKNLNLENDIVLVGSTTNVKKYYEMSKVFLVSSRWEGMPIVIDEALMFNIPVIAFDCKTGPREMIADGINGFLIPMNDRETFVEKMSLLSLNDERLHQLSSGCNATLLQRSDRCIFDKWDSLFRKLNRSP